MNNPSKAAMEAVERIAQRLRWGFFGFADREAMTTTIDRAIQEAAKPLVEAAQAVLEIGDRQVNGVAHGVYPLEYAATIAPMLREALHAIKGD